MDTRPVCAVVLALAAAVLMGCEGDKDVPIPRATPRSPAAADRATLDQPSTPDRATPPAEVAAPVAERAPRGLRIEYGYAGKLGMFDIADTASAYDGDTLIAKAEALQIVEKQSGPNHILIQEEHYSPSGEVTYKGTLEFRFGFRGGTLVEEKAVSGKKRFHVFQGWPAGN